MDFDGYKWNSPCMHSKSIFSGIHDMTLRLGISFLSPVETLNHWYHDEHSVSALLSSTSYVCLMKPDQSLWSHDLIEPSICRQSVSSDESGLASGTKPEDYRQSKLLDVIIWQRPYNPLENETADFDCCLDYTHDRYVLQWMAFIFFTKKCPDEKDLSAFAHVFARFFLSKKRDSGYFKWENHRKKYVGERCTRPLPSRRNSQTVPRG
jgi:hypothetical protein